MEQSGGGNCGTVTHLVLRTTRNAVNTPSAAPTHSHPVAPEVGFEPTTNRLTADRSTTELLRNFIRAAEGAV